MNATLRKSALNFFPLLVGVGIALIIITIIMAQEDLSLGALWDALYDGAWERDTKRARTVRSLLPLMLCSCGLLLTFTAGLWNIGIEGQITMGAIGATLGAYFIRVDSKTLQVGSELFLAFCAGAGWGLVAGVLRTRGGINEIFGGVALNFIALLFSTFMISVPLAPEQGARGSSTPSFEPETLLPFQRVGNSAFISYQAVAITAIAFFIVAYMLYFTRYGLQLRAIGRNATSAQALGIPSERNMWIAMFLCGGLAGLAGAFLVLYPPTGKLSTNVSGGIGFLALLVVLLASIRAWLVPFIAFAFAFMNVGAQRITSSLGLDPSLIKIMQGILVFAVLLFDGVRQKVEIANERRAIAAEAARIAAQALEESSPS